jgi:opine dehydrogenase
MVRRSVEVMKIAVLGGGNGSFAAAGDLALAGHEIRLWRREEHAAAAHRAAGALVTVQDHTGQREAQLATVTSVLAAAVADADLILCPVPAFAQPAIAHALAPLLCDGQVVFLPPGSFGSMLFAKAAHDAGNRSAVSFSETGTLPWLARKHGPYAVRISGRGKRLPTGVFPQNRAESALRVISGAFPNAVEPCGDALSGALMNAGPIIHPPLIMMNAGAIEHFDRWDIHKEGTQASIRRVTDRLDAERIAVREALGYGPPHFPLADHYAREGDEWMYGRGSHEKLTESGDWHEHLVLREHRYMLEDTRIGLSLLVSVAAMAGVDTPLARAFLAIGSAICDQDFNQSGRTLDSLGLGGLDRTALQALLRNGFT